MKRNEKFVITINRELGSGGRTVGEKLAERLGVPFYDKALIKALEEKYNLTVEEIERLKGRNHSWWADFKRVVSIGHALSNMQYYEINTAFAPDILTTAEMFKAEVEILKGMAEEESCVIAGRTGFHVFRDHPNHLSILIKAPLEQRILRLTAKRGINSEEAKAIIEKVDAQRENYVQKYTGTSRYSTHNYDLVISMKDKTEDEVTSLIMQYIA